MHVPPIAVAMSPLFKKYEAGINAVNANGIIKLIISLFLYRKLLLDT